MKHTKENIKELLERFLNGQTTETEEQLLADYFRDVDTIPEEWQTYKDIFDSFKTDAYDFSDEEIDAMLTPNVEKKTKVIRLWPWTSVACVAAVIALFIWHPWNNTSVIDPSSIAEVKSADKMLSDDSIIISDKCSQESVKENTLVAEAVSNNKSANKEAHSKEQKTIAANVPPKRKHQEKKENFPVHVESITTEDISTSELLETVRILADISHDDATIIATPTANNSFVIKVSSVKGTSNSYKLHRCSNSSSVEMVSECINF